MAKPAGRDPCLDTLLLLDGEVFVIDEQGGHWVKFEVKRVEESPEKPHGLDYSLTLHAADGTRLVGFDNAHRVASGEGSGRARPQAYDHRHRLRRIRPYDYRSAADLLADFWEAVEDVLGERGVRR